MNRGVTVLCVARSGLFSFISPRSQVSTESGQVRSKAHNLVLFISRFKIIIKKIVVVVVVVVVVI